MDKGINYKSEAIILVGIPASGKSTFYWENFADTHLRLNLDSLGRRSREMAIFRAAIASKAKICIDNTNINEEKRARYIPYLRDAGYKIITYYWRPDIEKALKNQETRERKVPGRAIQNFVDKFQEPSYSEGFDEIYLMLNGRPFYK